MARSSVLVVGCAGEGITPKVEQLTFGIVVGASSLTIIPLIFLVMRNCFCIDIWTP